MIMSESAKTIPEGYHSINPYLVVRNAARAIEFYKKAFGAEERFVCTDLMVRLLCTQISK